MSLVAVWRAEPVIFSVHACIAGKRYSAAVEASFRLGALLLPQQWADGLSFAAASWPWHWLAGMWPPHYMLPSASCGRQGNIKVAFKCVGSRIEAKVEAQLLHASLH